MAFVYRYINPDGAVMYIGKSGSASMAGLHSRISAHRKERKFTDALTYGYKIEFIELGTHADADIAETALISLYSPPLNDAKRGWGHPIGYDLDLLPAWEEYLEPEKRHAAENTAASDCSVLESDCSIPRLLKEARSFVNFCVRHPELLSKLIGVLQEILSYANDEEVLRHGEEV